MKHVVLVGATDGIGRALASEYLRRGWRVCVVGRDREKLDGVLAELREEEPGGRVIGTVCDVAARGPCIEAFRGTLREMGQMDLLVYCAGAMAPEGDAESRARAAAVDMAVNVVGAVHWLELAADYFQSLGRGRVAAIGSVAGERGRKGAPVYGASKAALHQYMEGLRHRLHGSGLGVSTIKPGWVATRMLREEAHGSRLTIPVERAAEIIADGLDRGRESFYVPRRWAPVAWALRVTPRFLYKRMAPP